MKKRFKDISSNFKKKNVKLKRRKGFSFFNLFFKNSNGRFKDISSSGGRFGRLKFSFKFSRIISTLVRVLVCLTLFLIIGMSIVVTGLTVYLMKASDNNFSIKLDRESLMGSGATAVMGLNDEGKYVPLSVASTGVRGIWVDLSDVPKDLIHAVIAAEDHDFLKHNGVNWKRSAAAAANFVLGFWNNNQGGSTITQQLIKNLTNDRAAHGVEGAKRKIREVYRALNVERCFSKDQILQAYLNIVHVGGIYGNFKGVAIAAVLYFGKPLKELNLRELTSIVALIRKPIFYDIFKHPDKNKARGDKILRNMYNLGFINRDSLEDALKTPIKPVKGSLKSGENSFQALNNHQSYFVDSVYNQVVTDYMKFKKISDWNKANEEVKVGGFKIYSTIDLQAQNTLEKIFSKPSNFGYKSFDKGSLKKHPPCACVIYDYDGNMKACVGNLGKKHAGDRADFNYATSVINPGSSNKPFVYAMAFKNNLINWSTLVEDSPVKQVDDRDWPKNFDDKYHGNVTIQYALENSLNTVPIKIAKRLGVEPICNFLINGLNFSTVYPPSRPYDKRTFETEAISIGSMTRGVKLNELTNAFQIFGNGGYFTASTTYEKVCNSSGEVLFEPKKEPIRVIDSATSAIMNRLLRRVVTNGTGRLASLDSLGIEVVGKTGTSDDEKSLSFIGLIPPTSETAKDGRIVGIWVGGPDFMRPVELFKIVCSKLFKDKNHSNSRNFDYLKKFVEERSFCKYSGQLAGINCPHSAVEIGYYRKDKLPHRCRVH